MELIVMPESLRDGYYIGAMDNEAIDLVINLTHKKRKTYKTICDYKSKNLQKHLKAADKVNAKFCAVIGSNELKIGCLASFSEDIKNVFSEEGNDAHYVFYKTT